MSIDFQYSVVDLPKRIRAARRRGLQISSDGFVATPDGPKHIDDMTRAELQAMEPRGHVTDEHLEQAGVRK